MQQATKPRRVRLTPQQKHALALFESLHNHLYDQADNSINSKTLGVLRKLKLVKPLGDGLWVLTLGGLAKYRLIIEGHQ